MNRTQSIFKHKHLLSIISLLLIFVMISTTALATEEGTVSKVVIKGNGGGNTSVKYGTKDEGSTKAHQMSTNNKKTVFVGYRVYAVDKVTGTLDTKLGVVDLIQSSLYDSSTVNKINSEIMIGTNTSDKTTVKNVKFTTNSANDMVLGSTVSTNVYKALDGWCISEGHGDTFNTWMTRNDGKNMKALATYAFGIIDDEDFKNKLIDKKLIVEPLINTAIFTSYGNVEVEKKYNNYIKHYLASYVHVENGKAEIDVYDCCCSSGSSYRLTKADYNKLYVNNEATFGDRVTIGYGALKVDKAKATLEISASKAPTDEVIKDLGYNGYTYYNLPSEEIKIKVYEELTKRINAGKKTASGKAYEYQLGLQYTSQEYYTYSVNPDIAVTYGEDKIFYADESYAYMYKGESSHAAPNKLGGKHKISIDTGITMMSTYNNIREYLKTVPDIKTKGVYGSTNGALGGYLNNAANGFYLSETDLDKTAGTAGIHIYDPSLAMNKLTPIHTKDPSLSTADQSKPHKAETPKDESPNADNTGTSTIIKVYGDIYKDDSGKVHHITDIKTYSQSQTTDWIVIEDEPTYKLQQWVVSSGTADSSYTATKWLTDTTNKYVGPSSGFDKAKQFSSTTSGYKLTYTEQEKFSIGKDTNNTIYLLYLKEMPYIKTSTTKVPDNSTQYEPTNPTYPENPYNPNNKDKQGAFTIIKLYALLDEYNGTPLSYEVYTQKQTTPFIKIQTESNWTLAQWYTTDKTNQSVTANDFLQKASTNDQLKQFYEKGFYLKTPSTATIGNIKSKGAIATTKYFNDGSNTIYLIYTRTKGQVNYNATEQLITESYLAKRFSTSGYWNVLGHFVINDLKLTVTTSTGTIEEDFKNHLFTVVNPKLNGGSWVDRNITFKVDCLADTNGSIIPSLSAIYRASGRSASGDPLPYIGDYMRVKFDSEAALFSDLEYRFTAYRKDDSVTLADWKINSSSTLHTDMRNNYANSANAIRNATNNYFKLGNTASHMGWLFFLPKIRYIVTV